MDGQIKDLQSRIERQGSQLARLAFPPPTCQDELPPIIQGFKRRHSLCFGENPADFLPRKRWLLFFMSFLFGHGVFSLMSDFSPLTSVWFWFTCFSFQETHNDLHGDVELSNEKLSQDFFLYVGFSFHYVGFYSKILFFLLKLRYFKSFFLCRIPFSLRRFGSILHISYSWNLFILKLPYKFFFLY